MVQLSLEGGHWLWRQWYYYLRVLCLLWMSCNYYYLLFIESEEEVIEDIG